MSIARGVAAGASSVPSLLVLTQRLQKGMVSPINERNPVTLPQSRFITLNTHAAVGHPCHVPTEPVAYRMQSNQAATWTPVQSNQQASRPPIIFTHTDSRPLILMCVSDIPGSTPGAIRRPKPRGPRGA